MKFSYLILIAVLWVVMVISSYALGYSNCMKDLQHEYPQFYNLKDSLRLGDFGITYPTAGQPEETYAISVWTEEGWEQVYLNQPNNTIK